MSSKPSLTRGSSKETNVHRRSRMSAFQKALGDEPMYEEGATATSIMSASDLLAKIHQTVSQLSDIYTTLPSTYAACDPNALGKGGYESGKDTVPGSVGILITELDEANRALPEDQQFPPFSLLMSMTNSKNPWSSWIPPRVRLTHFKEKLRAAQASYDTGPDAARKTLQAAGNNFRLNDQMLESVRASLESEISDPTGRAEHYLKARANQRVARESTYRDTLSKVRTRGMGECLDHLTRAGVWYHTLRTLSGSSPFAVEPIRAARDMYLVRMMEESIERAEEEVKDDTGTQWAGMVQSELDTVDDETFREAGVEDKVPYWIRGLCGPFSRALSFESEAPISRGTPM